MWSWPRVAAMQQGDPAGGRARVPACGLHSTPHGSLRQAPKLLGTDEIRDYPLYLTHQPEAPSSIVVSIAALGFLYNRNPGGAPANRAAEGVAFRGGVPADQSPRTRLSMPAGQHAPATARPASTIGRIARNG